MLHVKICKNPFIKNIAVMKTVIFTELQAIHTLPTDYGPICLILASSIILNMQKLDIMVYNNLIVYALLAVLKI